jgi:uncharacterized protein YukJ
LRRIYSKFRKMAAAPATWAEVLEIAFFIINVRAILTDVDRENLTFADMEGWHNDEVDDLIRTLRKTHQDSSVTLLYPGGSDCEPQDKCVRMPASYPHDTHRNDSIVQSELPYPLEG